MKYIDTRCCVVSEENGYILIIRYKCLSNNRHVFTLYIDERIAYSLDKHDYCTLGIEGKLKGLEELLFHAGGFGFSGGYIGVDIFFVISGYLITIVVFLPMTSLKKQ